MQGKSEIYFNYVSYYLPLTINYCNSTLKSKEMKSTLHNIYYNTLKKEGGGGFKSRIQDEKRGRGLTLQQFNHTLSPKSNLKKSRRKILEIAKLIKQIFDKKNAEKTLLKNQPTNGVYWLK